MCFPMLGFLNLFIELSLKLYTFVHAFDHVNVERSVNTPIDKLIKNNKNCISNKCGAFYFSDSQ